MELCFKHRKITGLACLVPRNERLFLDEMADFDAPRARSLKLKQVMGYDRHRLVAGEVCSSDLACFALEHLFRHELVERDSFDALVVVTQSPDYLMPPTSNVVQGRLGLKQDLFCLDINQGCAGFVIGLYQSFLMLNQDAIRKVALVNVDVLSRKVSTKDRNSYPLIGDAASVTIVERQADPSPIHANLKMDGTRREALMIPAGGFRQPATAETALLHQDKENNWRAADHLRMDGTAVFQFVQTEVPAMINALFAAAGEAKKDVDWFLFHQPNRFMLQKLAQALEIPFEKMPSNVVELYGNSSGVTIPLVIAHNLRDLILKEKIRACLAGFGVGLTWGSMLMHLGPLDFCEWIEFE